MKVYKITPMVQAVCGLYLCDIREYADPYKNNFNMMNKVRTVSKSTLCTSKSSKCLNINSARRKDCSTSKQFELKSGNSIPYNQV